MKYLFEDSVDKFPYRLLTKEFSSKVFGANGKKILLAHVEQNLLEILTCSSM